jgi:polysaccharide biosynthesis/export protein
MALMNYSKKYVLILLRGHALVFLIFLVLLNSCRSSKDLTLLNDLQGEANLVPRSVLDYRYRIKINDNLFVSIVSSNVELNQIYNPATAGSGSQGGNVVNVWGTQSGQFIYGYMVDVDGYITLPSLGKIHVVGMTIPECELEIETRANQYLKDVTAKVRLLNYKVTILGEVIDPGVYFNYNPDFTIMDLISMARGTKNTSALDNVLVIRQFGNKSQTFKVNLNSAGSLNSEAYNILPNDIVIIQPAKFKNLELRLPIYTLILSSITTFVLVLSYIQDN